MTTALAIGCGGTIGGAWTIAALHALAEETGWDPRDAAVLQGTSAGAELVTMLGGIAPVGRGNTDWLQRLADGFSDGTGWVRHPGARMVAFDYRRGERVPFGAPGAPQASAGEALRASWAVPGWMPPVTIGGRNFVDGGAASTASVDLIGPEEADTIYVITPMASEPGTRATGLGRLEHSLLRRPMSVGLDREVASVRARGTKVVVIRPDAADLTGLGSHFMRRGRRKSAFEASMLTAPTTVRRALAVSEVIR